MIKVLDGVRVVEQGTFITGPAAAMLLGRPRRRRDQGRAARHRRSVPRLQGRPLQPALPDLQPQQAQHHARHQATPPTATVFDELIARRRRLHPELPPRRRRAARRRRGAAARRSTRAWSTARSAASARAARRRTGRLRHRRAGGERLPAAARQPRQPARRRPGDRRCDDRLLRGLRRPRRRCTSAAAPARGRTVEVSMLEAMAHFNLDAFTHFFPVDEVMGPYSRPSVSQSYVLECADGKWIALHMSSPEKFWQGLATAIERPDLFDDAALRDPRGAHRAPGGADRAARRALQAAHRATNGASGSSATTCRTRRCTTPARRSTIRRRATCSSFVGRCIR